MLVKIMILLAVSVICYVLFLAAGNKPVGVLILLMGFIMIVSTMVKGCVPYVEKVQSTYDEVYSKVETIRRFVR